MAVRKNFSWGATLTFCLSFSGCWPCNENGSSQNALLYRFYTTKKDLMLRKQPQKLRFLGSNASFSSMLFSHSIKIHGLPLSVVYVLLHYLPKISVFNRRMRQNAHCL